MAPFPVVIRTFDLGGRKLAREVMHTREANPVLGLRGIRLTLARPEIFKVQLRALLRAGVEGDLRILVPLVATVEEIRAFKQFIEEVRGELESEGLACCSAYRLGAMIEVPAAALMAEELAREVEFLSIGSNDLIQYSMAVDRNNEHVSYLYRPLHPAILRMIRFAIDGARAAGIEVSICGEMAGEARFVPLLVGMGLRVLSVSPRAIPAVRSAIEGMSAERWAEIGRRCQRLESADAVEQVLQAEAGTAARV